MKHFCTQQFYIKNICMYIHLSFHIQFKDILFFSSAGKSGFYSRGQHICSCTSCHCICRFFPHNFPYKCTIKCKTEHFTVSCYCCVISFLIFNSIFNIIFSVCDIALYDVNFVLMGWGLRFCDNSEKVFFTVIKYRWQMF